MNNDALKVIYSSDNESIGSEQPMVSLIENTGLEIHPTKKSINPTEPTTLETNPRNKGVRKILSQDTLKKIRVNLEDNHTVPPDIQQTQTPVSKNIKKNKLRAKTLLYLPNHIKNLEDILRNKRKLDEADVVTLSGESSA